MSSFQLTAAHSGFRVLVDDGEQSERVTGVKSVRLVIEGVGLTLQPDEARLVGRQLLAFAEYLEGAQRTGQVAQLLRKVDEL